MTAVYLTCLLALSAAEPTEFVVQKADGGSASGTLTALGGDWSISLAGKETVRIAGGDVLSLRRAALPLPPYPDRGQLLFANGDRWAGNVREIARERVAFTPATGDAEIPVPLSVLSAIWLADPSADTDPALLRRRLLAEPRQRDAVWLRNGDVIEGTLTALDKEGWHVESNGKDVVVERGKVAYAALNTELARAPRPKGTYARLTLADGSRLGLSSATADERKLSGRTLFGAAVEVPSAQVVGLDLRQGRAVYLSDLKPRGYKHTPWSAGLTWPSVADGSAGGRDLCLGGATYDKGLGLHCKSEITFALEGAYQRFDALVGLDDHDGREGVVRIRMLVDGKPRDVGWDKDLTARDGAKQVRVNVAGAETLTLIVERGRGGWWDQQGLVNWVDARLVK